MRVTISSPCSILLVLQLLNTILATPHHDKHAEESLANNSTNVPFQRRKPSTKSGINYRLTYPNSRFIRRPRKKQSDPARLLQLLGNFFDPRWMSIEEPKKDEEFSFFTPSEGWQYDELTKSFDELNVSQELEALSLGGGSVSENSATVLILKKWLLQKGTCPIKYTWEDVGILFWPRWIKRGECANKKGTCSWPPGMHCVPSGSSTLNILRWQCRLPKSKGRRKRPLKTGNRRDWKRLTDNDQDLKCQWIRIPYPVISECMCTC